MIIRVEMPEMENMGSNTCFQVMYEAMEDLIDLFPDRYITIEHGGLRVHGPDPELPELSDDDFGLLCDDDDVPF